MQELVNHNQELVIAQQLIDSKTLPSHIKTPQQMIVVIQKGKELGLPPLAAAANLPFINGIPTPTVHLLVAKAMEAGSMFEIIDNYKMVFEAVYDPKTGEEVLIDGKPQLKRDFHTTIRISTYKHGKWFESNYTYKLSQANQAGYLEKDNWKKMTAIMMLARCMSLSARFAQPGATMGLMTYDEVIDVNNVKNNTNDQVDEKYLEIGI